MPGADGPAKTGKEAESRAGGESRLQRMTSSANRWVRDFGTDVTRGKEWKSLFATGWCRYRAETHRILSERPAAGGDAEALIECITSTCNEAGKRAFGMCGGGQRGGGGLLHTLAETATEVLAGLDTLLSGQSVVDARWAPGWVPWADQWGIAYLVRDYCTPAGPRKAKAGNELTTIRKEIRDEMKRMGHATQRRGKKRWQTNLRASFLNNTRKFLKGVLREPRGRGGAVPERDENGVQAAT